MIVWEKLGKIFKAEGQYSWMTSHTTPVAALLLDECVRIFIVTRSPIDQDGCFISNTSFIDVDKNNLLKVLYIHNKPILELGGYGNFDEFGVMVTDVVKVKGKIYLYYAGWQRLGGKTAAYQVLLGLAISEDNGFTFTKVSDGPIMGIDYYDPITIGNVAVVNENQNWKMYYTSLTHWVLDGKKPTYEYVIKYAVSKDGIFWQKTGKTVIGMEDGFGVATPTVVKIDNMYHMWFGFRKAYNSDQSVGGYKIGYAFSADGENWNRNDELAGLQISNEGWDSQMVCYPNIIKVNSNYYMFYCGNEFGKEGFGVAELKSII